MGRRWEKVKVKVKAWRSSITGQFISKDEAKKLGKASTIFETLTFWRKRAK